MKWVGIVFLSIFAILFLITLLHTGVRIKYFNKCLEVFIKIGFFKLRIVPSKKMRKIISSSEKAKAKAKAKPTEPKPTEPKASAPEPQKQKKRKFDKAMIKPCIRLLADTAKRFKRKIIINNLTFHADIGLNSAADTAIACGVATASASMLVPLLEEAFKLKKADILFNPDYNGNTSVFLDITASAMLLKLLIVLVSVLIKIKKIMPVGEKGSELNEKSK